MSLPGTKGRKRIYLMRHGEVSYVAPDGTPVDPANVDLTGNGRQQATAASRLLSEIPLEKIICSGLPRTVQTAEIVAAPHGLTVESEPGFREIRGGRLSRVSPHEREAAFVYGLEIAGRENASFAGGEKFSAFKDRITQTFDSLIQTNGWHRILLVAHDVVNRMILSHCCGAGLNGLASFEQDMACVNVIDIDLDDGLVIRRLIKAMNITPYNNSKNGMYETSFEQVFKTLIDF